MAFGELAKNGAWEQTAFPVSVDSLGVVSFFFPCRLSAALEISFIVRILSLKQYEATTFTGAPG